MPTRTTTPPTRPGTVPVVTLPLLTAIENTWSAIQGQHPDVPAVVVTLGPAGERGRQHLGHFAPDRWQVEGEPQGELFIGGEGLTTGPSALLVTLLHAAAHAIASTREIQDTSRQGRYHNTKFRQLAEEVGLVVASDPSAGWSPTDLALGTAETYAAQLDELSSALTAYRHPEPAGDPTKNRTSYNGIAAVCGCPEPRRIRVHPSVLDLGPIRCDICGQPFTSPASTAEDAATSGGDAAVL